MYRGLGYGETREDDAETNTSHMQSPIPNPQSPKKKKNFFVPKTDMCDLRI